jgi:hypothetical protein
MRKRFKKYKKLSKIILNKIIILKDKIVFKIKK